MTDIDKVRNELLNALLEEMPTMLDEANEVCVGMMFEAARLKGASVTERTISNLLDQKVEKGELERRFAMWRGRRVVAYRKKDVLESV